MEPPKPGPGSAAEPATAASAAPASGSASAVPPAEVRQRWRVIFRRRADADAPPTKELIGAWESGLSRSGLPLAGLDLVPPRPRMVFGAPLPAGVAAERELLDLFLVRRCTIATVRDALAAALPAGHELVDLHDVWLGAPALSGQVAAADYRVRVRAVEDRALERAALMSACEALLRAASLPRTRDKGGREVRYDLRPLVASASALSVDPAWVATLGIRTRFDQERGVGRPEEVVAAIGDAIGMRLEIVETVRERLYLIGEL